MTTSAFASIMAIAISHFTGSAPPAPSASRIFSPIVTNAPAQQHSETRVALVRPQRVGVIRTELVSPVQAPVHFDAKQATSDTLQAIELGADQLAQLGVSLDDDGSISIYETNAKGNKVHRQTWHPDGGFSDSSRVDPKSALAKPSRVIPHAVTLPSGYARMFSGGSDRQGFANEWIGPPPALSYSNAHSVSTNGSDKREWFESRVDTTNGTTDLFKKRLPEIPMPPPPPPPPPPVPGAAYSADFVEVPQNPELPQKHYQIKSVAIAIDTNVQIISSDSMAAGQTSVTIGGSGTNRRMQVRIVRGGSDSAGTALSSRGTSVPSMYLPMPKVVGAFDSSYEAVLVSNSPDSDGTSVTKQRMVFKYRSIPDSALPRLISNEVVNGEAASNGPISNGDVNGQTVTNGIIVNGEAVASGIIVNIDTVNGVVTNRTVANAGVDVANLLDSLSLVRPQAGDATIHGVVGVSVPSADASQRNFEHYYRSTTGDTATFSSLIPIRVTNYNTPQHFTLIFWYDRKPEVLNLVPRSAVETADARPKNIELSVYPNPTNGVTDVHYVVKNGQTISINVVSLLGHNLIEGGTRNDQHGDMTLNLSALDPGVYLLIATLESGEKAVERIVVTK